MAMAKEANVELREYQKIRYTLYLLWYVTGYIITLDINLFTGNETGNHKNNWHVLYTLPLLSLLGQMKWILEDFWN